MPCRRLSAGRNPRALLSVGSARPGSHPGPEATAAEKMTNPIFAACLRGRYRAAETRLRGWAYRTRTRKCRFNPARSESVSSRRPRKVSGTKMLCKPKEFGREYKKQTFPSSSPLTPATQSGLPQLRCEPEKANNLVELVRLVLADVFDRALEWSP